MKGNVIGRPKALQEKSAIRKETGKKGSSLPVAASREKQKLNIKIKRGKNLKCNDYNRKIGLSFDKEEHKYYLKSQKLSGITSMIGEFPEELRDAPHVKAACAFGSLVHDEVENYIKEGKKPATKEAKWTIRSLYLRYYHEKQNVPEVFSEVLVSDYRKFASCIDILVLHADGKTVDLYDLKTGVVKIDYVEKQLGIYKSFIERHGYSVGKCGLISSKYKMIYPINPVDEKEVLKILYK